MGKYRKSLEPYFRDYIQSVISGVVGLYLIEGKIEPLDCQTTEDYGKFLDNLYDKCFPEIISSIKDTIGQCLAA